MRGFFNSAREDPLKQAGRQAASFAEAGKVAELRELLASFPAAARAIDGHGHTPLHHASGEGHAQVVSLLLSHGRRTS